jgi:hypothetical protein
VPVFILENRTRLVGHRARLATTWRFEVAEHSWAAGNFHGVSAFVLSSAVVTRPGRVRLAVQVSVYTNGGLRILN